MKLITPARWMGAKDARPNMSQGGGPEKGGVISRPAGMAAGCGTHSRAPQKRAVFFNGASCAAKFQPPKRKVLWPDLRFADEVRNRIGQHGIIFPDGVMISIAPTTCSRGHRTAKVPWHRRVCESRIAPRATPPHENHARGCVLSEPTLLLFFLIGRN